jgi:hypothetical protein
MPTQGGSSRERTHWLSEPPAHKRETALGLRSIVGMTETGWKRRNRVTNRALGDVRYENAEQKASPFPIS